MLAGPPPEPGVPLGTPDPNSGLPPNENFTPCGKSGLSPDKLLLETSRSCRLGKDVNSLGMGPTRLLSFNEMLRKEVKFAKAGEMVPENFCFPKLTEVTFFPEESQVMKVHPWQASLFFHDCASDMGYPSAPATSRRAVTWGSQGPGVVKQKEFVSVPKSDFTRGWNTGNGP